MFHFSSPSSFPSIIYLFAVIYMFCLCVCFLVCSILCLHFSCSSFSFLLLFIIIFISLVYHHHLPHPDIYLLHRFLGSLAIHSIIFNSHFLPFHVVCNACIRIIFISPLVPLFSVGHQTTSSLDLTPSLYSVCFFFSLSFYFFFSSVRLLLLPLPLPTSLFSSIIVRHLPTSMAIPRCSTIPSYSSSHLYLNYVYITLLFPYPFSCSILLWYLHSFFFLSFSIFL